MKDSLPPKKLPETTDIPDSALIFPPDFYFGASSASHQVEGGNNNQWTQFEFANASRLAREATAKFSTVSPVWDEIKDEATNPRNYISGRSSDHYHLYEKDFDIAKSLGMNAQRISLEWSRIEPEHRQFSEEAIHHYRDVIRAMKARGLEPFITLYHWTLPHWVAEQGGWKVTKTAYSFKRYVEYVMAHLGNEVTYWVTLNEPEAYADVSYSVGDWPPMEHSRAAKFTVLKNLASGHKRAYRAIKASNPNAKVGIAKHNFAYESHGFNPIHIVAKALINKWWNYYFLVQIKGYQDYIGVNYYIHARINWLRKPDPTEVYSDLGWELFPHGMYEVLKDLKRYKKPIYILENGLADRGDRYRTWYIKETLKNVRKAMDEGVDVRGYLHWSLLDNFEWDKGYWPRFGLIEVDYKTLKRTVRKSAREYAKIIKASQDQGIAPKK